MYYVYLLRDLNDKMYIGYSVDLKRRIQEHNHGKTITTKRMNHPNLYIMKRILTNRPQSIVRKNLNNSVLHIQVY